MKKRILLIVCLVLLSLFSAVFLYRFRTEEDARVGKTPTAQAEPFSHALFEQVLQEYVDTDGNVNYAALKANPDTLEAYLDKLAVAAPTEMSYNAQMAFWINAYNALVIKGVVDRYPTTSVRKLKPLRGFFSRLRFQVAGKTYTLNQIEDDIIRMEFVDARIHFALVCASRGCPPLEKRAFLPETIETQLDDVTLKFVTNPAKVRLDRSARRVSLSKIFEWYADDFTEGYTGVADFLSDYLSPEDADFVSAEDVSFHYLDYDWTLNDKR